MPKKPALAAVEDRDPIELTRVEIRTEMVPLTDAERCERLEACAGIEAEITRLEGELTGVQETQKSLKTSIDAKTDELRRSVREAHEGNKGSDFDVLVERHPEHPQEMVVWRIADGLDEVDIMEEQPKKGETTTKLRERQGCTLIETRAMTSEELDAAADADFAHRNPELPLDGLDAPTPDAGGDAPDPDAPVPDKPTGKASADSDDDWESDPDFARQEPDDEPAPSPAEKPKGKGGKGKKAA